MQQRLKELREATDECIEMARESRDTFDEAINWGDLGCVEASKVITDKGTERYVVLIEEASPDCIDFQEFISFELGLKGFDKVEVRTEW